MYNIIRCFKLPIIKLILLQNKVHTIALADMKQLEEIIHSAYQTSRLSGCLNKERDYMKSVKIVQIITYCRRFTYLLNTCAVMCILSCRVLNCILTELSAQATRRLLLSYYSFTSRFALFSLFVLDRDLT